MAKVIEVKNISKLYALGVVQFNTLRDSLLERWRLWRGERKSPLERSLSSNTFWALKDVSFSVERGEIVGLIGKNAAGKSTLLRILSHITKPTEGRAILRGRVGSLLEIGTGFHPELTGRENIYLNGAIFGMRKSEVKRKLDEIVAFAEIEAFLDTPVKRYSSGMYVRLAFAVAAHLEAEILLVDEVLAVGDISFQRKCLGKMGDVVKEGRTILLVSHQMAAVENLCSRALLLEKGRLTLEGSTEEVIKQYLKGNGRLSEKFFKGEAQGHVQIKMTLLSEDGHPVDTVRCGEDVTFVVEIHTEIPLQKAGLGIGISDMWGQRIATFHTHYQCDSKWEIQEKAIFKVTWPENFLCPGPYLITASVFEGEVAISYWPNAATLNIAPSDYFKTGKLPNPSHQGYVLVKGKWEVRDL
ncbi:MAG: ABC transporter ATP-binding protein [Chlamydiae bacterium]|nr:ABC transporter ATP-binding protein [Chlamydiota bacterium]MBI3267252.1 ABC transporter ATP-binding protein [Chlamydiota bacterium]